LAWSWSCGFTAGEVEPTELGQPKYRDSLEHKGEPHEHSIRCVWIWHNCTAVLGPKSVAPGVKFGWMPTGIGLHTLVSIHPLTITASLVWPECCGLHGYITEGRWIPV
jgi:hypothetical protein